MEDEKPEKMYNLTELQASLKNAHVAVDNKVAQKRKFVSDAIF